MKKKEKQNLNTLIFCSLAAVAKVVYDRCALNCDNATLNDIMRKRDNRVYFDYSGLDGILWANVTGCASNDAERGGNVFLRFPWYGWECSFRPCDVFEILKAYLPLARSDKNLKPKEIQRMTTFSRVADVEAERVA